MFTVTTLAAQSLASTQLLESDTLMQGASGTETYRLPVITCTVGSAGFLGNAGRQAGTIEMVVALGVTYSFGRGSRCFGGKLPEGIRKFVCG
jgi:hypothetical protein